MSLIKNEHDLGKKAQSSKVGFLLEIIVLSILVILNVLDFFEILTPELDYIKKIISWSALCYILYRASLSKIFFGHTLPFFDMSIVLGFFSMVLKNFIHYARIVYDGLEGGGLVLDESTGMLTMTGHTFMGFDVPNYLVRLYSLMVENEQSLLLWGFIIGFSVLTILAFISSKFVSVEAPSLMHALGIEGEAQSFLDVIKRFFANYFVYLAFFVVIFNLVMEWLAIAVDAPLLMVGLVFYFFSGNLGISQKLEKLGNMGSDFYQDFMDHFKDKSMIVWGVAGMLVLHLITDIPNLIFPYVIGLSGILYSGAFETVTVWEIAWNALQGLDLVSQIILASGYLLNVLGILMLMIAPAFIWYHVYKESEFDISPILIFIFTASSIYYLIDPLFSIGMVDSSVLLGASVGLLEISPTFFSVGLSLGIALLFSLLSLNISLKRIVVLLLTIGIQVFFLRHIYYYLISSYNFYSTTVLSAFSASQYTIVFFMGIIGLFTLLFYSFGSLGYIVKTWK